MRLTAHSRALAAQVKNPPLPVILTCIATVVAAVIQNIPDSNLRTTLTIILVVLAAYGVLPLAPNSDQITISSRWHETPQAGTIARKSVTTDKIGSRPDVVIRYVADEMEAAEQAPGFLDGTFPGPLEGQETLL